MLNNIYPQITLISSDVITSLWFFNRSSVCLILFNIRIISVSTWRRSLGTSSHSLKNSMHLSTLHPYQGVSLWCCSPDRFVYRYQRWPPLHFSLQRSLPSFSDILRSAVLSKVFPEVYLRPLFLRIGVYAGSGDSCIFCLPPTSRAGNRNVSCKLSNEGIRSSHSLYASQLWWSIKV